MNFITELFLAWRYFKPKRNAVSVITLISVVGVSLGVCVLMVVLAIMTGFTNEIKTKLLDITPHIQIESMRKKYITSPEEIVKKVDKLGATAVSRTEGQVLVQKGKEVVPQLLVGIDESQEPKSNYIQKDIISGHYSLEQGEVMVSYVLANRLGLYPGSKIIIHSPAKLQEMVNITSSGQVKEKKSGTVYLPSEFTVAGIFSLGMYDYDKVVMITNLDDADDLFGYPWGAATKIAIKTENPFKIDGMYDKLLKMLPEYKVLNWKQLNQQFLNVLAVEKNMMFFVLIFIVLVAASSITNTLITVVVQKTREIGLLRSIGASRRTIMKVFVLQGFFVGFVGTCLGLVLGTCVVYWRMEILNLLSTVFHVEIFPRQFYYLSKLPAAIVPSDLIFISLCTIILCTVGALIPAYRAARLDPAKALRYE
jgi:lipoprotein-releasing system permease protein